MWLGHLFQRITQLYGNNRDAYTVILPPCYEGVGEAGMLVDWHVVNDNVVKDLRTHPGEMCSALPFTNCVIVGKYNQ